jgi:hypothetical protein
VERWRRCTPSGVLCVVCACVRGSCWKCCFRSEVWRMYFETDSALDPVWSTSLYKRRLNILLFLDYYRYSVQPMQKAGPPPVSCREEKMDPGMGTLLGVTCELCVICGRCGILARNTCLLSRNAVAEYGVGRYPPSLQVSRSMGIGRQQRVKSKIPPSYDRSPCLLRCRKR